MFEIIDSSEIVSYDNAKSQYRGYVILMKDSSKKHGYVYAVSDYTDLYRLTELQQKFHKEGVETTKLHPDNGNNYSLINTGWGIL
ncbi:MAG: hypothetical protein IJ733_11015 [Lachnospiraceae bacterium]|nr:hypothetical protein [Lachnospiraceae bacterium]